MGYTGILEREMVRERMDQFKGKKNRLSKTRKEKSWCPGLTFTSGVGFVR